MGAEFSKFALTGLVRQSEHVRVVPVALSVTRRSCRSILPAEIHEAGSRKFRLWFISSRLALSCQLRAGSMVSVLSEFTDDHKPPGRRPRSTPLTATGALLRSEEHTSELQSPTNLVCRLLLEKKKK